MEPLLLLAHKYDLKAPLQLCTEFLAQHFSTSAYTNLARLHLAHMPTLLVLARQLQLTELHSSIMACLADNLSKLSAKSRSFVRTCKQKAITPPTLSVAMLQPQVSMAEPAETALFSKIWQVPETMRNRVHGCMAQQQILSALQSRLQPQEVMQLLAMIVGVPSKS